MGPIRCPETSVNHYHTMPRNIPEERNLINIAAEAWNQDFIVWPELLIASLNKGQIKSHDSRDVSPQTSSFRHQLTQKSVTSLSAWFTLAFFCIIGLFAARPSLPGDFGVVSRSVKRRGDNKTHAITCHLSLHMYWSRSLPRRKDES
jgi:hypothetical protein